MEIDAKRFEILCSQIKTTHAFCVKPIKQDALTLDPQRYLDVEYILVDPSCSGSGKILLSLLSKIINEKNILKNSITEH